MQFYFRIADKMYGINTVGHELFHPYLESSSKPVPKLLDRVAVRHKVPGSNTTLRAVVSFG